MVLSFAVVIATLTISCSYPRYALVDSKTLESYKSNPGGIPQRRFLLTPLSYRDSSTSVFNSPLLQKIITLERLDKKKAVAKHLSSEQFTLHADSTERTICFVLNSFFMADYSTCLTLLNKLPNISSDCFLLFIKTDCMFENNPKLNYTDIVAKYQEVLDCSDNELHRELVKDRIKLIRYGY